MTRYVTGVLTVIAAGVVLIAYALLAPGAQASLGASRGMAVAPAMIEYSGQMVPATPGYVVPTSGTASAMRPAVMREVIEEPTPVRTTVSPAPRQLTRSPVKSPRRDWKKTALVIGGSSAAGAGVGAIFGGKKGALIGAAIGGGASTIYETTRR